MNGGVSTLDEFFRFLSKGCEVVSFLDYIVMLCELVVRFFVIVF